MESKIIFENYLLVLKSTVEVYVHGTLESSNEIVRNTLKSGLDEIMQMQANTYQLMTQNGWYQVDNINSNEIVNTLNKLESQN